ncbi:RNA polymerase-associated protein CTR9 [Fistulifera solaris]|uniref:RNA polymerase-associated protein CTR9 n=1 Tax=Fistulifera solaris TaxID=1519565 RepID=A0A1Z5J7Q4_FISSO|nr:RNA polymerase-associated protein CTR9 [Fistulifera solaris]|eukprot:GAX09979.1 RNA polymerase-associated protein CTR9 [Fistulifera solaris]
MAVESGLPLPEEETLIIPIKIKDGLFIEMFPDEVAQTSAAVLKQVLRDEAASGDLWAASALFYSQNKQAADALAVLEEACELETNDKQERVRLLAACGIAHLMENPDEMQQQQADQRFTQAGKIDTFFPMTWIGRGLLNWGKGGADQAKFFFQTTLKQCGPVLPALLGMAAVLYGQGDYEGAQNHYATAIRRYPNHPTASAAMRTAFGLTCYQLGQVDRAKAAFTRALQIDPDCVEAMVGSAVLDMAALDETAQDYASRTERAIKLMSMANLLDHSNAMVQNHLANHYFWKWTPLPGVVQVTQGSVIVKSSQPIPLDPGEPIRIGTNFEASVKEMADEEEDLEGSTFTMSKPWKEESTDGLKAWKKDYERVIALAKGAYKSTRVKEIQAESLFFLARVYHAREDMDNAHKFYRKACDLYPGLNPARFGLAQTLIVRKEYNEAANELQELVRSSSKATDALGLLGLLQVHLGKHLDEGLTHLRQAIELDPLNPELVVLEAMALQQHRTFYPKSLQKYQKAVDLMNREGVPVPSHILTNMGVLCQETRKYDEALKMYKQALASLDETGEYSKAELENVGVIGGEIRHPDNSLFFDFLSLSPETEVEVVDGDEKNVVKIVTSASTDVFVISAGDHIRLGELFQTKVESVDNESGNLLLHLADEYVPKDTDENDASVDVTENKRLSLKVKRENRLLDMPNATTVIFNIARLHEATGRALAAIELHKAITKRNPAYVNSYLRLACIAVDSGSLKECSEWLKIAAASSPGNSEVLTLIGNLHLSLCDWKPAQDVFEGLMGKKIPSVEAYAALSMGNIYFETLHVSEQRYAKHLQYASDYYKRILLKDPLNAYAANGLGTVLAEKGEIFKAKEIFGRVREVSEDSIADALLNLGHIYLAQKKHPEALQMYQNYMKRIEDVATPTTSKSRVEDLVDVLLYIAFAYFDWARHTELSNDSNAAPADGRYKQAMEYLTTALSKRAPKKEVVVQYNLCMTKLQAANCVLQKQIRNIPRTVEEVEEALKGLEESLVIVEGILKQKEEGTQKINIKTSVLEDFLKHCKANIGSAQSHLEDEKKRAEDEVAEREIRRLAAEAAQKEEQIKLAIKKAEEAKLQEERDMKAAAKMQKMEELRQGWQQQQAAEQSEKEKKARKRNHTDDFIVEDDQNKQALFDDDSDDDESRDNEPDRNSGEATRTKAGLFGDSDDEGSDAPPASSAKAVATKSELFGDSDEEDEDTSKKPAAKATNAERDNSANESDDEILGVGNNQELFGDDSNSDDELVRPDKRDGEENDGDQPKKKRRVFEDDE